MSMEKCTGLFRKERKKQQERLEKLYGPGNYMEYVDKNQKHTQRLLGISALLFLVLLITQMSKSSLLDQGVTLDQNGNLKTILRPNADQPTYVLEADVISESGDQLSKQGVQIIVSPQKSKNADEESKNIGNEISSEDALQHQIRKAVYRLNEDTTIAKITVPKNLDDGTRVFWIPKKRDHWTMLILLFTVIGFGIFRSRDAGLSRIEKETTESVLRELPEFVNKLVLLLNAGLILSNAFNKITLDYQKMRGGENNYFYGQLVMIMQKCNETNGSIQREIRNFAIRTGVVEFMRLSNIIGDSMTKGSDLMLQLKMEGDNLWAARRKQLEEKGKIAETKLTFPLVILLLVLVMITIAPAMMEM
jgi:tight adherence protein C